MDISEDEMLDWIDPDFFGFIIGKRRTIINEIERKSEAKVTISGTCSIRGNEVQREEAKQLIREHLDTHKYYIDESYTQLDFVQPRHIGGVMGKRGANIERLKIDLNVVLKVNSNKLFIKGDPDADQHIRDASEKLKMFVWVLENNSYEHKCQLILGNPESITTVEGPGRPEGFMSIFSNQTVDVDNTIQENHLVEAFQITKDKQKMLNKNGMSNPCVEYSIHPGRMFSNMIPGRYQQNESFKDSLIYRNLTGDDLDIAELESSLEKIDSVIWYDFHIYTPESFHKIRYKIFLSNEADEEEPRFITNEEAGFDGNGFRTIREGPGYFYKLDMKIARVEFIDSEHGLTTRINTMIYDDSQPDGDEDIDGFNHHLEILTPFYEGIEIRQDDDIAENAPYKDSKISIPELPQGYKLRFYRRVTRASYRFNGENILRICKEKVFLQEDNFAPTNQHQSDFVDLILENEAINDLLRSDDWEPRKVVDELTTLLNSSKTMLAQYLEI